MDETTRDKVLQNMTTERDLRNQMAYARKEAIEEGLAEGRAIGIAEGRAEGLAEGRAEGRAEAHLETALKLRCLGVDLQTISEATGLSVEDIQKL